MNGELVTGSLMEIEGVSLFFDYCSRTAKRKTNHDFRMYMYISEKYWFYEFRTWFIIRDKIYSFAFHFSFLFLLFLFYENSKKLTHFPRQ